MCSDCPPPPSTVNLAASLFEKEEKHFLKLKFSLIICVPNCKVAPSD